MGRWEQELEESLDHVVSQVWALSLRQGAEESELPKSGCRRGQRSGVG